MRSLREALAAPSGMLGQLMTAAFWNLLALVLLLAINFLFLSPAGLQPSGAKAIKLSGSLLTR
ncbi:hypothetical protein GCM10023264_19620 [Sphingomonas daechungensis]|uniref:Uncharacterized protein n=1 Tax=Sphingomonas daechungensis TaxID=1176646 RepID=A0ABX6T295_9SPHN|nr:hypothetical protein [Sphingomonas daechungensis]QNP43900.1 hypothetical protein H9L15_04565 [Sphingomonas daechungensis]